MLNKANLKLKTLLFSFLILYFVRHSYVPQVYAFFRVYSKFFLDLFLLKPLALRLIERLYQYITYKELSFYAFERGCGMANGYLKKQYKGKGTVGSDMLEKIHKNHIDLSLMWLLTGEGAMLEESGESTGHPPQVEEGESGYMISKEDIITLLREQVAILEKSLADKEKIILMLEGKLRKLKTRQ